MATLFDRHSAALSARAMAELQLQGASSYALGDLPSLARAVRALPPPVFAHPPTPSPVLPRALSRIFLPEAQHAQPGTFDCSALCWHPHASMS